MAGTYRNRQIERDLSGFARTTIDATAGTVLKARKGRGIKRFQNDTDLILQTGTPDPTYPGVYDAIEYVKVAPLIVSFALGDGYAHAGLDVREGSVVSFGTNGGRDLDLFENNPSTAYDAVEINTTYIAAVSGDGVTKTFSGTISPSGVFPITEGSVKLKVGSNYIPVTDSGTSISGDGLEGTGVFNKTTGEYNIEIKGTSGTPAYLDTTIDLSSGVDLSSGGTDKKVNIEIDKTLFENVNLGSSATTSISDITTAINAALGYTCVAGISGGLLRLTGQVASVSAGNVKVTAPSSGESALNLVFDLSATSLSSANAVSPTGYVPKVGDAVVFDFTYAQDLSELVSHSIFMESPFDDSLESYAGSVERISGKRYRFTLYSKIKNQYYKVRDYEYSLIKEKNGFGASIYYEDVFRDTPYVRVVVNPNFTGEADPTVQIVDFSGGKRGSDPTSVQVRQAWTQFQYRKKWKAKMLVDFIGDSPSYIRDILSNYQPYAHGLVTVPYGQSRRDQAIAFRQSTGIDWDNMSLFSNWMRVEDVYNGGSVWISKMGSTAVQFARTAGYFDGLPAAGPTDDFTGTGGILTGFRVIESETEYTDGEVGSDLQALDDAQINPKIIDENGIPMIYGNRTLQIALSDTSYIHTRRIYNKILEDVSTQIMRKQEFKLNDELHRLVAKSKTDTYLVPILAQSLLRDAYVVCDESNNGDDVLERREFVLDIYVKATPDSEFVILRLTRLPQGGVISDYVGN